MNGVTTITSPAQGPPWRRDGTRRSWGGKHELPLILSRVTSEDAPAFEKLALTLLRPAMSPPDRLLDAEAFETSAGGYLVGAGETALPVFVQPLFFAEGSQALGEPHVQRCREAIARFADSPVAAEIYLLVHNRDPRRPVFRTGLAHELAALVTGGRVAEALSWDARDLVEAAFDGLFDFTAANARRGRLSVAPVEPGLATSTDLLSEVPLRVSWLTADQHRLGAGEDTGSDTVADPAALVLAGEAAVRTFLLGGFGFGKTTAVARALQCDDRQVLYVPGASLTQEVATSKVLLSRCLNSEPLFGGCLPADRQLYARMLRAVVEHLFRIQTCLVRW
ncbi:MAG TPA: hypothetical protein VEG34_01095 [Thermoanaerobaculia bacterium]|nr:hypothetical protein [Thermoanaerobaculia bacterium]